VTVTAASDDVIDPVSDVGEAGGHAVVVPDRARAIVEVIDPGASTTVQDVPGRVGYWHIGVPPNGPMDDLSHRLVNRVVGNHERAAALEITGSGPTLRFPEGGTVAVGGAPVAIEVNGLAAPAWVPLDVPPGGTLRVGIVDDCGLRVALGVRGGFDTVPFLGSRSTFTLGQFGGHDGRTLQPGDAVPIGDLVDGPAHPLAPGAAPAISHDWEIGVLIGPHAAPDFLTTEGLEQLLATDWEIHFNSARTGVRLIGPAPRWARADGGDAGLHPSNIHDTGYAIGSVDLTGDMPVILGPDGPSLGGFVCPAVVAVSERWKLGQLRPGDRLRLVPWSVERASNEDRARRDWLARATARIEPVARPLWNRPGRGPVDTGRSPFVVPSPTTVAEAHLDHPPMVMRRAGDRFLLVEFGEMMLDLELRVRVHALEQWVHANIPRGVVDATAGVRSLLIQVDGDELTVDRLAEAVSRSTDELDDLLGAPFPSRVVHLPLSWDDPATREAIERYMHGVRPDAPWCPWNIEFIRRINGLGSVDDVKRIVFDASYLVLGLGDVYLGAPVATPLDPRHRLVTTKYNPARTWTAENSVGIGGSYLCIYGMEGPGGYQFVGRTVQVWNRDLRGPYFAERPWLLRNFDQIRWFPVEADELLELREKQGAGELELTIETSEFRLDEHRKFLAENEGSIDAFRRTQQAAFAVERQAWADAGELS
jgi:urea carboxylase